MKQHTGTTILLSLLVLSGVLVTVSLVSSIVFEQLKLSKNIDESVFAYYAAEAGAERGLYILIKDDAGTFHDVIQPSDPGDFLNGAGFSADNPETKNGEAGITGLNIQKNQSFQINLFNQDDTLNVTAIKSLVITEGGTGSGWAEVSWTEWNNTGVQASKTRLLDSAVMDPPSAGIIDFGNNLPRRVRIKALYADLSDIAIRAYSGANGTGNQEDIPGRVVIKSVGNFGDSLQAVKVSFSPEAPIYGLYDYVIFSQESLIK